MVFSFVEAVEAGRAVRAGGKGFERDEKAEGEEFFAEISFVDFAAEDGFVERLNFGEGEMFWE